MKTNTKKNAGCKKILVLVLCCAGAVFAAFIGLFTFLGKKAAKKRKTVKNTNNPLERESLRDEF